MEAQQVKLDRRIWINKGFPCMSCYFITNKISTCKYSLIAFVPVNIFQQFHRIANIWFLVVSILQVLAFDLSPTSSWATIAPLTLVIILTMAKDLYLDWRRHQHDEQINKKNIKVWDSVDETFTQKLWKELKVGNIILLQTNQEIPADCLLLSTSGRNSYCYIETSNLDGESSFKQKIAPKEISSELMGSPQIVLKSTSILDDQTLEVEEPNSQFHRFQGNLSMHGRPRGVKLDIKNLILRGCFLKNTHWALALVVYSGPDTKLMQNFKIPPNKRSNIQRKLNKYLLLVFLILFIATTISSFLSIIYALQYPQRVFYFTGIQSEYSILVVFTFMILFNSLVPISLYVTVDFIRICQTKFIQWDLRMYSTRYDQPAVAKTADLNEDLGQIEYIFADKTGTLTENQMQFRRCVIDGTSYGGSKRQTEKYSCQINQHPNFKFNDPSLIMDLREGKTEKIMEFFQCLALCNTVIPQIEKQNMISYQGAYPDQQAMVIAAHCFGVTLYNQQSQISTLKVNGQFLAYRVLGINHHTSQRRRMSVVVQPLYDWQKPAILICKGADQQILNRCIYGKQQIEKLYRQNEILLEEGLRVMWIAKRELSPQQAQQFQFRLQVASENPVKMKKNLESLADEFQRDMKLVGSVGIQDKIQQRVPESIQKLLYAGIKIWVISGDKLETAVNISRRCGIISNHFVYHINQASPEDSLRALKRIASEVITDKTLIHFPSVINHIRVHPSPNESGEQQIQIVDNPNQGHFCLSKQAIADLNISLVLDGRNIEYILSKQESKRLFCLISFVSRSIICARITPSQKAELVRLVKTHFEFNPATLAIGDGVNDVAMIQEAHVGVGLSGRGGSQAANNSDYAVTRFKHLVPLLLGHGRWNYIRTSKVILYSIYKNFLMVLPMFYYAFQNMYSGTAMYDSWFIVSYNVVMTGLPIIVLGIFDKDLSYRQIDNNPHIYADSIFNNQFNLKVFAKWTFMAILHSVIIYVFLDCAVKLTVDSVGMAESYQANGVAAFYVVVQTVTYAILNEMNQWTVLFLVAFVFSWVVFYPFLIFYDYTEFPTSSMRGVTEIIYSNLNLMIFMYITPLVCFTFTFTQRCVRSLWYNNHVDKLKRRTLNSYQESKRSDNIRLWQYNNDISRVYKFINEKDQVQQVSSYSFSPYTLIFQNRHFERRFKKYISQISVKFFKKVVWGIFIIALIYTVYQITSMVYLDKINYQAVAFRGLSICGGLAVIWYSYSRMFNYHEFYDRSVIIIISVVLIMKFIQQAIALNDASMSTASQIIYISIFFNVSSYKILILNIFFTSIYLTRVGIKYYIIDGLHFHQLNILLLFYSTLLFGILALSYYASYTLQKHKRTQFLLQDKREQELKKGNKILGHLLPTFVKDRVKEGKRYIADQQISVTVVFCDIYDFNSICVQHTPDQLMTILNEFFEKLDSLCAKWGVFKIQTVNKTYMVCGGLTDLQSTIKDPDIKKLGHAQRCIGWALKVIQQMNHFRISSDYGQRKLQVKIGVNSGPVIAGVVGDHKPQFALVGNTVNTASRMCSTIESPNKIQISQTTKALINQRKYHIEQHPIQAKGLGNVQAFYLSKKKWRERQKSKFVHGFENLLVSVPEQIKEHDQTKIEIEESQYYSPSTVNGLNFTQKIQEFLEPIKEEEHEFRDDRSAQEIVNWLVCSFKQWGYQREFRLASTEKDMQQIISGYYLVAVFEFVIMCIDLYAYLAQGQSSVILIILRAVGVGLLLILALFQKQIYTEEYFQWIVFLVFGYQSVVAAVNIYYTQSKYFYTIILQFMYQNLTVSYVSHLSYAFIIYNTVLSSYLWIFIGYFQDFGDSDLIQATFFLFFFFAANLVMSYTLEKQAHTTYTLRIKQEREISNIDRLLSHMIPQKVLANLRQEKTPIDIHQNVTILYADICGFTSWSHNRSPNEVISKLHTLFSEFDRLCYRNDVYKVHTIGDCYVILSFNYIEERNPTEECLRVINVSLEMISQIKTFNKEEHMELNMRIGVHTGDVIAGVTGTNIVRYDIYGADNEIANKMESEGIPGKIHVSETTKKMLESVSNRFRFVYNKRVHYKPAERTVKTYFLNKDVY